MFLGYLIFGLSGALWGIAASQFLNVPVLVFYNNRCGVLALKNELLVLPMILVGVVAAEVLTRLVGLFAW